MKDMTEQKSKRSRGRPLRMTTQPGLEEVLVPRRRIDQLLYSGAALALEAQWEGGTFPPGHRQNAIRVTGAAMSFLGAALDKMKWEEARAGAAADAGRQMPLDALMGTVREHSHHAFAAAISFAAIQAAIGAEGRCQGGANMRRLRERLATARDHQDMADAALAEFMS